MANSLTPGAVRTPGAPLTLMRIGTPRAIENPAFPFDKFCEVAELESWRKEIARPVYHVHKWWAQRLGSVFRAILIGTLSDFNADVSHLFYQPVRFPDATIFDPFMGSGTTVGEAAKLGARAIGRDINPVACFAARTALQLYSRDDIIPTFREIESDLEPAIRHFYQTNLGEGHTADVLYYFWVMVACISKATTSGARRMSRMWRDRTYPLRLGFLHLSDLPPRIQSARRTCKPHSRNLPALQFSISGPHSGAKYCEITAF